MLQGESTRRDTVFLATALIGADEHGNLVHDFQAGRQAGPQASTQRAQPVQRSATMTGTHFRAAGRCAAGCKGCIVYFDFASRAAKR